MNFDQQLSVSLNEKCVNDFKSK